MTKQQEEKIALHVSTLLHTIRRIRSKTQQDIADLIGISQSNYSKMERGLLMPSAKEWAIFCMGLNIPVSSMIKGCIDEHSSFDNADDQDIGMLKFPQQYLEKTSLSVRYLKPLLNFGESTYGAKSFFDKLKSDCKVEPGFFVKLDHKTNHKLMIDLTNYLLDDSSKQLKDFFNEDFQSELVHGDLHAQYLLSKSPIEAVKAFLKNADQYDRFYQRKIIAESSEHIEIDHKVAQSGHKIHRGFMDEFNANFLKGVALYPHKKTKIKTKSQNIDSETTRLIIECA